MAVFAPAAALRIAAHPLVGAPHDWDRLLARVGDARLVLLGEATHGTHEFYRMRAEITKRLVRERGFSVVAVEADWPDAHRVHRYVTGQSSDADAVQALGSFERFPRWMWRNADVLDFVGWLREENDGRAEHEKVAFFGLDLYSLHASIAAVLGHLETVDPRAARRARERYACFDAFGEDTQLYGYAASLGLAPSCEDAAVAQLLEMQERSLAAVLGGGSDALFSVEQNARLVVDAEAYYRSVAEGSTTSWNVRDAHMADTIDAVLAHLELRRPRPKIVVWEHNSHVGDGRATRAARSGRWNVGQLVRERHGAADAVLVGFTTYEGTVTAASDWDAPAERRRVRPAPEGSWEALFHEAAIPRFLVVTNDAAAAAALHGTRLERAIGVVYRPETERASHTFEARIGAQFDVIVHVDRTRAVEPLETRPDFRGEDAPETYPFAV